jgi:hypothetical protein
VTIDLQDKRRQENRGILNGYLTPPSAYIDLDAELLPPPADQLPAGFEALPPRPEMTLQHREPRR